MSSMKPDGKGTDERVPGGARRPQAGSDFERKILKLPVAFAIVSLIVWGAVYLSRRVNLPDQSGASDLMQQAQ